LPGERNPQSVAEEFAPPPQGENVLDASMMAELIVTKKEIAAQLKESAGTSRARPKSPGAVVNDCRRREGMRTNISFFGSWVRRALLAAGLVASVWTPVEGKIGADTAARTQVIQGHSQDRQHGKRHLDGSTSLDMAYREFAS
jgi:hypothetical protein